MLLTWPAAGFRTPDRRRADCVERVILASAGAMSSPIISDRAALARDPRRRYGSVMVSVIWIAEGRR